MQHDPRHMVDHRVVGVAALAGLLVLAACGREQPRTCRAPDYVVTPTPSSETGTQDLPDLPTFSQLDMTSYVGPGKKYLGIGVVLKAWGDGKPNAKGYNAGCSISVEVLAGKMRSGRRDRWTSPGRILEACSYGGDVGVFGQPVRGSLVGYREDGYCLVFEELKDAR